MMPLSLEFTSALKNQFPPDFSTQSPSDLEIYGRDWTKVFPPKPSVVVFPRTTDEVIRFVKLCSSHRVAIVPSGGRTGLAGGAVATQGEAVLSLARMNLIGDVDTLAQTIRVQAGAITEAIHHHCAPYQLTWPVDFASKGSSHVGGNIATNAGGVKVIRYGMTRNWILGLQVVTMQGEVLELNGALEKNNTGLDLRQLFIGSEGTLGIITEATLKLVRIPEALDVFFFAVEDMPSVLRLFHEARRAPFDLMAFECLTHNCLETVTAHLSVRSPFAQPSGAYVLMEVERPSSANAQDVLDQWLERVFNNGLALNGTLAQSPREAKELWSLRESTAESLFHKGFLHKNDIAIPVSGLEAFVAEMYQMFDRRHSDFEIYLFGHIGDGNLHVNTMKPPEMDRQVFLDRCSRADDDLFALVQKHRGSISAEHGIGLLKKDSLKFSRRAEELNLLRRIKHVFDPLNLLNPGKILD